MKNTFSIEQVIKDKALIAYVSSKTKTLQDGSIKFINDFVLQNGTKLSDAFNILPHGIIDKTITGIGGTTLELYSKRNSIIVEPLKSIAATKAAEKPDEYMYVGSAFGNYKSKISDKNIIKILIEQEY